MYGENYATLCDEYAAKDGQYLTVHNNDDGQLIINVVPESPSKILDIKGRQIRVKALAVYNKDVWESWKEADD